MAPCGLVAHGFGLRPSGRIVRTVPKSGPLWESRISFHKKGLSHDDKPFLSLKLKV